MELKRIELGDNDYAVVLSEMTHRTHKIIEKLWEDAAGGRDKWNEIRIQVASAKLEDRREILRKLPVFNDAEPTILNQVKELWLDGKSMPITQETLDNMSQRKLETLWTEVDKLYSTVPLPQKS